MLSKYDIFDVRSTSYFLITILAHTRIFLSVEAEYSTSNTIEYWYNVPVFFTALLTPYIIAISFRSAQPCRFFLSILYDICIMLATLDSIKGNMT